MRPVIRFIIILTVSIMIGGCSFFQDKDEEILPAELIRFDEQ